ncbi:hypothetical protein ACFSMW_07270 [Virgibacillus halophilus]|uniref:hypothetical protein n=1 Tax=Tigheibacillus halophilus TaxID=361280 RepID=UPI00362F32BE
MSLVMIFIVVIIILFLLIYYDKKTNYGNIPIYMRQFENGEYYFFVRVFVWQKNKIMQAQKLYMQNTYLHFNGYEYVITHGGLLFPVNNALFIEKEIRYFGKAISKQGSENYNNIVINQYGEGLISIDLSSNEIVSIEKYISQDNTIDLQDKEVIEAFLQKLKNKQLIEQQELSYIYTLFLKYEPLASFGINLFNFLKSFLK